MRSRRGPARVCMALGATALVHVALGLLGGGCGQFGLTSVDAADGAAPSAADGSSSDAETSTSDGAMADGSQAGDAGDAGDASDARDASLGAPDGSCGTHGFCANFELPAPEQEFTGGHTAFGTIDIAAGVGWPGNALASSIQQQSMPFDYAYVAQNFVGAAGIHVEVEVNVPPMTLASDSVITLIQFSVTGLNGAGVGVVLASHPTRLGFYVAHGDGSFDAPMTPGDLPRGRWVHLVLDMHYGAGQNLKLVVDDGAAFEQLISTPVPASMSTSELRIGAQHYNGLTPAAVVLFDSVRADVLP